MKYQELWHDIDLNKYYILKEGSRSKCDEGGNKSKRFIPYCTGSLNHRARFHHLSELTRSNLPEPPQVNKRRFVALSNIFSSRFSIRTNKGSTNRHYPSLVNGSIKKGIKNKKPLTDREQKIEGIVQKKKLFRYNIKEIYLDKLKTTFSLMQNMKSIRPEIVELLQKDCGGEKKVSKSLVIPRSYNDIQNKLKKEQIELPAQQERKEKAKQMSSKGIFNVTIPSENELYARANRKRDKMNPRLSIEKIKRDEKDKMLLKKNREQRVLKFNKIQITIHSNKQKLLKEIRDKSKE